MLPEKTRLQQASEELVDEVNRLLPRFVARNAHAAKNLRKSAQSTLNNVAEGLVAWNPNVKLPVYEVGRREAAEVRTILRMLVRQNVLTMDETRRAYNLAGAIIAMLTSAAKSLEQGKGR